MKTGSSMGRIYNTRKVRAIKCDCRKCFHHERISALGMTIRHCKYYSLNNPNKTKCARFSLRPGIVANRKKRTRKSITKRYIKK